MNTKILGTLSEHIGEVTVMRREKEVLGTDIKFLGNRKVSLNMNYYKEESIIIFNKDLDTTVSPT